MNAIYQQRGNGKAILNTEKTMWTQRSIVQKQIHCTDTINPKKSILQQRMTYDDINLTFQGSLVWLIEANIGNSQIVMHLSSTFTFITSKKQLKIPEKRCHANICMFTSSPEDKVWVWWHICIMICHAVSRRTKFSLIKYNTMVIWWQGAISH